MKNRNRTMATMMSAAIAGGVLSTGVPIGAAGSCFGQTPDITVGGRSAVQIDIYTDHWAVTDLGTGKPTLFNSTGNTGDRIVIITGAGSDVIRVHELRHNDVELFACTGDGNDRVDGGRVSNHIESGAGHDVLKLPSGLIWLSTGPGDDRIEIDSSSHSTIYSGDGEDTIEISGGANTIETGSGDDDVQTYDATHNQIQTGSGDDDVDADRSDFNSISGGPGDDEIETDGTGFSWVSGGSGNDRLQIMSSDDNLIHAGPGHDTVTAGSGDDYISLASGNDSVWAGAGDDEILSGGGFDWVDGESGFDLCDRTLGASPGHGDHYSGCELGEPPLPGK